MPFSIRPPVGGPQLKPVESGDFFAPSETSQPASPSTFFRAAPTLELRTDIRNPIRSTRHISTLGDIRDAIVFDFIQPRLRSGTRGAQVVQQLGSFPGFLHSDAPLIGWQTDQRPDFNVIGDAQVILENLAPLMGWNQATLEANQQMAVRGMVYYNPTLETLAGPVKFKIGIIDTHRWRDGMFYFNLRASMLPKEGTYTFLGEDGERSISPQELQDCLLQTQTEILGKTFDSLAREDSFSAETLTARRFRQQFNYYEWYRVFEFSKGKKQRRDFEKEGIKVSKLIVPGLRRYLEQNPNIFSVRCGDETLNPDQITPENFYSLKFVSLRSPEQRKEIYQKHLKERSEINHQNMFQSFRNISTTRATRPGPNNISPVAYVARKFGRWVGLENQQFPREYSPAVSHFNNTDERLGRGDNPISQMIILAGYGPGDENDPKVFADMVDYAESEISKGAQPNVLFKGNNPSKFTLPVRGIPTIAYRFMDALRSPAIKDVVVVGTPDVMAVLEAFQKHFAKEIKERGKRFISVDTGLEGAGFTKNLQDGLDALPQHGEMSVLSFGDTPRVDIHNVAYYPWRHNMDFILGTNGRDMVLDFMGMNAHYQMSLDGVSYAFKEGNVEGLRHFPQELWAQMFANRKSVKSGAAGKAGIFFKYLFSRPTLSNPVDTGLDILHLGGSAGWTSLTNFLRRRLGGQFPKYGGDVELGERIVQNRVGWRADFRPFHLDMGGLVDVDGIRDYVVAEEIAARHPHPYSEDLDRFAQQTLPSYRDRLPLLEGAPNKINQIYLRIREDLLQHEAERPSDKKLGINSDTLSRLGFDPDILPFQADGKLNPAWLERVIPKSEIERMRRAFVAYDNRVNHATQLVDEFQRRIETTQPYEDKANPRVERFAHRQINLDPERYRGLILEWDFSRIEESMVRAAQKKFGEFAPEVEQFRGYFRMSTEGNVDTPLRRVLLGMKAVDALRRYQSFISPEEFRSLYPYLVETIHEAGQVMPNSRLVRGWRNNPLQDGKSFLVDFFGQAQVTADRTYVRRVGESPSAYRSRGIASVWPHSNSRNPIRRNSTGQVMRVDSAVILPEDVQLMARRLEILPSRIPHLMARAAMADSSQSLANIPGERMSFDHLLSWVQSSEGQVYMKDAGVVHRDIFRNHLRDSGPGFAGGMASLLGAELLADRMGLDAYHHGHERFMLVVGTSHLMNQGVSSLNEVMLNRSLGTGFDFVTARTVNAGNEMALQYGFEARSSFAQALGASLVSNLGLEGSLGRIALNGARGLASLPIRTAWGMGSGLMASALIDQTFGRALEEGSPARHALQVGTFFLPDLYHLFVGNRGAALYESRLFRYGGRAFAMGFMADMAFQGINRVENSSEAAATNNVVYQQTNQLHDEHESAWRRPIDGLFEMLMPSIAAWWDSTQFNWNKFDFQPNRYQVQVREQMQKFSQDITSQAQGFIQHALLFGMEGEAADPAFYAKVDWGFLKGENSISDIRTSGGKKLPFRMILEELSSPEIHQQYFAGHSHEEQAKYIQEQFSGYHLSREETEIILEHVAAYQVRSGLAQFHQLERPGDETVSYHFDEKGRLIEGQESALLRSLFAKQDVGETELLKLRRVALGVQILKLNSEGTIEAKKDLDRYLHVAQQIGIADTNGNLIPGEIQILAQAQFDAQQKHALL